MIRWKWVLAPVYCWSSVRTSLSFVAEVSNLSNIVSGRLTVSQVVILHVILQPRDLLLYPCWPASRTIKRGNNDLIKCWILDQYFLSNTIWSLTFVIERNHFFSIIQERGRFSENEETTGHILKSLFLEHIATCNLYRRVSCVLSSLVLWW